MEEIVRGFNAIIEKGQAYYWGTSMWSAQQIEEAIAVATRLNLIAPSCDQPHYSALYRDQVEVELAPLFKRVGYGTTVWYVSLTFVRISFDTCCVSSGVHSSRVFSLENTTME